jgi:F-type H+-transporting ATPase subunit b
MTVGSGGLFDFNATLPLMVIQFILLMVVLTLFFYKPVSKVLDKRKAYIDGNLSQASEKLIKADELNKQRSKELKRAKVAGQAIIADAEKGAKEVAALQLEQARKDAIKSVERATQEIDAQKSRVSEELEDPENPQIDELSDLISDKILGEV